MNKSILVLGLLFLLIPNQSIGQTEKIKQNFKHFYILENVDESEIKTLINTLLPEGAWDDIDYSMTRRSNWTPLNHLKRLKIMAIAYNQPNCIYYQNSELADSILKGFEYWCNNNFWSENWWQKQIGIPQNIGPILILCDAFIPDATQKKALLQMDPSKIGMSGQNKIWLSGNVFMRALLRDNQELYNEAATTIKSILVQAKATEEGLQPDFSFHQHGPQLQFGNYGLHFAEDLVMWMFIFNDTALAFPKDKVDLMRNLIYQGQQKVVYKGKYEILASGRQLFPEYVDGKLYRGPKTKYNTFKKIEKQFNAFDHITNPKEPPLGYTHFQNSDYSVYRTPDYLSSVRMSSRRIIGAEAGNGENQQGYYLGDGTNLIYRTGDEYYEIYPVWNWKKLPGTTIIQDTAKIPVLTWDGYRNDSDFAGGLNANTFGITAFKYRRDDVTANKSYFFMDNKIYAMGSGISSNRDYDVVTSINQCMLKGEVITLKSEVDNQMVWHDSIAYFSMDTHKIQSKYGKTTGNWNKVISWMPDTEIVENTFYLGINHGSKPISQQYAYASVVGVSAADMPKINQYELATIIAQTENIHALSFNQGEAYGMTVFNPSKIRLDPKTEITFHTPCITAFIKTDNGWAVSLVDPTQKASEVSFTINGTFKSDKQLTLKTNANTKVNVKLPEETARGTTVYFNLLE